jgi:folate-dependent phosphoribosylglycinamide formyltransferase PurN
MTRIAVFAYSDTGYACLKLLLDRREKVVFVGTHRETPGENVWYPSVAELARAHGLEALVVENPLNPQVIARLRVAAPDLLFSFYYRRILPEEMLSVPRLGAWNMHGSLLPKYRGRAPVNWAVLKGESSTGATLHVMTSRADTGAILDQEAVPIGPDDTAIRGRRRPRPPDRRAQGRHRENDAPGRVAGHALRQAPAGGRPDRLEPARERGPRSRPSGHAPLPRGLHGPLRRKDLRLAHAPAGPGGARQFSG